MKRFVRSAVLITIVVMSVVMMFLPYQELKHKALEDLNERQRLIAMQASLSIENFFSEQRKMLRHFTHHPNFYNFTHEAQDAIQREFLHASEYIKAITLYDKEGIIRYSYPNPESSVGVSIIHQRHVQEILTSQSFNVSDVFLSVQGYKAVAISEPMFRNGKFVGVVAFLIDFQYIAKNYLENIRLGEDGYAWMISRDGTELYCPVPGHSGVNVMETSSRFHGVIDMAKRMMRGESGATSYTYDMVKDEKLEIIKKYAVYMPIRLGNNFWSVVIATPENEIYLDLSVFVRKMALALLLMISALLAYISIAVKDYSLAKRNEELQKLVDIEVAKRQKQEKMMLQQAKFYSMTETLNSIAHQWRQPLNAIGLCVQDMQDAFENGELNKGYITDSVDKTMAEIDSLSATIDDFSNFFAESQYAESINIQDELNIILNIVRIHYDTVKIVISYFVDKDGENNRYVSTIYPDKLRQVVLNCLVNSKEAIENQMDRGRIYKGDIKVTLKESDGEFTIEIIDNGGGIDEKIIDRVFDPYFTTKDVSIGMGQGLYISKSIVEESLGGRISIENYLDGAKVSICFKTL